MKQRKISYYEVMETIRVLQKTYVYATINERYDLAWEATCKLDDLLYKNGIDVLALPREKDGLKDIVRRQG